MEGCQAHCIEKQYAQTRAWSLMMHFSEVCDVFQVQIGVIDLVSALPPLSPDLAYREYQTRFPLMLHHLADIPGVSVLVPVLKPSWTSR